MTRALFLFLLSSLAVFPLAVFPFAISPAMAEDDILEELGSTNVDWLSFGILSLDSYLTRQLVTCLGPDCYRRIEIDVDYVANPPEDFPSPTVWPDTGQIVISVEETQVWPHVTEATEDVCLNELDLVRAMHVPDNSTGNLGRFFLPRDAWKGLSGRDPDQAVVDYANSVADRMLIFMTQAREWRDSSGIERAIYITCVGRLDSNEQPGASTVWSTHEWKR